MMKPRTLLYHFSEGIKGMRKNSLMSLASIAVVSACIFILILSLCFVVNVSYVLDQIESNVGISLLFGDEPDEKDIAEIEQQVKNLPHVTEVKYCSKDDALDRFKDMYDAESMESLREDNPLPRSLDVKVDSIGNQAHVIKALEELQRTFEKDFINREPATEATTEAPIEEETNEVGAVIPQIVSEDGETKTVETPQNVDMNADGYVFRGITKVKHLQDVTETLVTVNIIVNICSGVLLIVLAVIAVVIIMNTIKLTVFIRKNEINIMKFVGATDWFIRWPFVIEGVIIGLIGAAIPCLICWIGYDGCVGFVNNLRLIKSIAQLKEASDIFFAIAPFSLMIGVLLGAIGSISSLEKHLNV